MHEFLWLESLHMPPDGTLEDGIALANRLEWHITWAGMRHGGACGLAMAKPCCSEPTPRRLPRHSSMDWG